MFGNLNVKKNNNNKKSYRVNHDKTSYFYFTNNTLFL